MTETLETKSSGRQTFLRVAAWVLGALFIYTGLTKVAGNSFGITLPIELVRILGWRPRQKINRYSER